MKLRLTGFGWIYDVYTRRNTGQLLERGKLENYMQTIKVIPIRGGLEADELPPPFELDPTDHPKHRLSQRFIYGKVCTEEHPLEGYFVLLSRRQADSEYYNLLASQGAEVFEGMKVKEGARKIELAGYAEVPCAQLQELPDK